MRVLHQIGKKIHGLIHDMEATNEADFAESFDALLEGVCKEIISIIDYVSISEYGFIKNHSYYSPSSAHDDLQGASLCFLCLRHIDALMHDLGNHDTFTKSITKKLFFQLIKINKRTCCRHFLSSLYHVHS